MNLDKLRRTIFLAIIAIGMGYIVWNSPLVSDDLYYQSFAFRSIKDIFHFALTYNNGRLFGNMLIHYVVRSSSLRVLLQTGIILSLWLLTYSTSKNVGICSFFACIAMFLAVGPAIFRDTYLWSSAFANYFPGIICMLIAFNSVQNRLSVTQNILLFIVSVCGQLFVEHTSLINIVCACCVFVFFYKVQKDRPQLISSIIWLGGAIIGAIIMFAIPKMFYITSDWVNYQKVNLGSLHELIISIVGNGMQIAGLYWQNTFAFAILSAVIVFLGKPRGVVKSVLLLLPVYGFSVSYTSIISGMINLLLLILYFTIIVLTVYKSDKIKNKLLVLFYFGMCLFSVMPLLVVYPIGARCLLHSYVFLVLGLLSLINNIAEIDFQFEKRLANFCFGSACALICFLSFEFHQIGIIDRARLAYTHDMINAGNSIIIVPKLPSVYVKPNSDWDYDYAFFRQKKLAKGCQ